MYPKAITNLIECFKKLPSIGSKTAERLALSCLQMEDENLKQFSNVLSNLKTNIKYCVTCGNFSEGTYCSICEDNARDKSTICVVENPKDIIAFEKLGKYQGTYHVLGGLISPLDGINPEDLNIQSLLQRINKSPIKEVIIAVKPTIEGETTALYIQKILEDKEVAVSKLAHGMPMGADIDYMDPLTLEIALEGRNKMS